MDSSYRKMYTRERLNSGTDYAPGLPEGSPHGAATTKNFIGTRMNTGKKLGHQGIS